MRSRSRRKSPLRGMLAGSLSGLLGTILMTQFQLLWKKGAKELSPPKPKPQEEEKGKEKEDSTIQTAKKISKAAGHDLSDAEKKRAGNIVHYSFGAAVGGIYGVLTETAPRRFRRMNPTVLGIGYGTAVFLGAHELAVPALNLGSNPLKEPVPDQISEYLAHLVYGVGTSLAYSVIRRLD